MKDAKGYRQQSSFKSFLNKPRNYTIYLNISSSKFKNVKIEFNTKQFMYSQEEEYIINYVKQNIQKLLKKVHSKIISNYLVKRTLPNGKNFLVVFEGYDNY